MQLTDVDLYELLDFSPGRGVIRMGAQRVVIFDAVALGLLRKELIETFGSTVARGILTRFGYAHGWRAAETLRTALPWESERQWRIAGGLYHVLQGFFRLELVMHAPGDPAPFAESLWHDSYEAEQHLLHLGQFDEPVCWTLCGFGSGYLSFSNGKEIYCKEVSCRGQGDAVCHMVGQSREEWGHEIESHLPFFDRASLDSTLQQVTQTLKKTEQQLRSRRQQLGRSQNGKGGKDREPDASGMIAISAIMHKVLDLARRVSQVDAAVLITGESGVGKERIAQLIHTESARSGGPFIAVNCGAVPESLLESELFGHARGAFTGATHDRPGLFEAAHGGTLFLDEIGDIPAAMQVKLLRALQEHEIRRVGENRTRPLNVRVLAATNRDLKQEVEQGRFRRDVYYRLRVIEIHIPALQERRDDILPLAREFLADATQRMGRNITGFTPQAADQLLRYSWPGNVRELHNALEGAVVLANGNRIEIGDLPEEIRHALPGPLTSGLVRSLAEIEREYILAVFAANGSNQAKTAAQLKIGTATLYRKLRQYKASEGK